ncbi:Zinc-binding alcohol dehydrogenase domain-containing protein cipB [Psilocybe cubensis]|uniref:Enoyl reductase (ER) domain-containing protein n=2 Tax=Psilocybe cubensis TaxID=181762 RepID=A0A8H7Y2V1_PSICU|nr:Zinc-binding alcohol dehydrogenase domain-containing protein cipB [Psilocybe cubensis]KAH9481186.1 Zinc-binding alcohol dehydrogenase domain-containing protein cipB [Psilocybe cubensis]
MSPSTQRALMQAEKSGPLSIQTTEIYKPLASEILIRIQASALNPVDAASQRSGVFIDTYPAVLGLDIAGDVEDIGEGVTDFKKGERVQVFTQGTFEIRSRAFQQFAAVKASTVARIPDSWSYDQASALPVVVTCAYVGLYNQVPDGLGIPPPVTEASQGIFNGTAIVVLGGATSVGQIVIQFAKFSGFSPIFTTASSKHAAYLQNLGATHVFDRNISSSELSSKIDQLYDARQVSLVYDAVSSASTQQTGLDVLSPGGKMAIVLPLSEDVKVPDGKVVSSILGLMTVPQHRELLETLYHDKLSGWLESGVIKPNNIEVLPNGLEGIVEGLSRLEAKQISASKLVAHPQETI